MSFPNYVHSYPYNVDIETTTGYSGPVMKTVEGQRVCAIKDVIDSRESVRNSIEAIINTSNGERVMRPGFGAKLRNLLFEPLDGFLVEDIKTELTNALNNQEPRIVVKGIEMQLNYQTMTVNLSISFMFTNTYVNDTFNFAIQY